MMNPILLTDFYKTEHFKMYPENTEVVYSNLTARKSRMVGTDKVIFFGLQYFIKEYLVAKFDSEFFKRNLDDVIEEYGFAIKTSTDHIAALHKLGYLPIEIKALPEGSRVPIGVPMLTIKNTKPEFYWLTNYLETLLSNVLWQPITSATIADKYYTLLSGYAKETVGSDDFVTWQGHDFSMRGMQGIESAIISGMGHLTSFTGTDTIPAIYAHKKYYNAKELIGASVPATEHSVMCAGSKDGEFATFARLMDLYPEGVLSVVSDTWDLWKVCTEYLPALKEKVMARRGTLVVRPDSGDPVDIICGRKFDEYSNQLWPDEGDCVRKDNKYYEVIDTDNHGWRFGNEVSESEVKGVIELLWDTFGGEINSKGYKVLHPCIGAIYGDSITLGRAEQICKRLKEKGFASTNIVLGIGSYTYTYNTRDTFGMAVKATHVTINGEGRAIFKDPITDDGTKKSAKGLLRVEYITSDQGAEFHLLDNQIPELEKRGLLQTVFKDGIVKEDTLEAIRARIKQSRYVYQDKIE